MNRNIVYTRVLLVVVAVVVLLAFTNRSSRPAPRDSWLPSSFNPVGAGHMALFQTLQELGWPVERWREPFSRLSDDGTGNVLIMTRSHLGSRVSITEQEAYLLDAWVKKGNTLLLLGALEDWDDTRMFLEQIGFTLPAKRDSVSGFFDSFSSGSQQFVDIDPAGAGTGTLVVPRTPPLSVSIPTGAQVLWGSQGQPFVVKVPRGTGNIICGASDQLLSNASLGKGDNLAILLQLLAPNGVTPRHLLFEESHHGFSAVFALYRLLEHHGVRFAGMLALLGALAFLGSSLVRFGPVIPLRRETGRSTLEFVDSIADLYLRADLRNDTIKYLFHETHQRILQRLNLPPTVSHDLIASRLQQANPTLPKWKKLAQRFDSRDYMEGLPPSGWLRVAQDLIEIKSAMA